MIKKTVLGLLLFIFLIITLSGCVTSIPGAAGTAVFIYGLNAPDREIKKREKMEKKYFTPEKAASAYTFPSGVKEVPEDYKKKVSKDTELAF